MDTKIFKILIFPAILIFLQAGIAFATINPDSKVKIIYTASYIVDDDYKDYVGRYRIEGTDFEYATVTVENGKLYGKAEGQERVELVPQDQEGHFYVPSLDVTVRFIRDDQNEVSGLTIVTDQETLRGEKVG